jgi:cell division protein FtsZ
MGSAKEEGTERAKTAIVKALDSPLLNDNKISGAKNVLLLIVSGTNEVTLDEIGEINDYIQDEAGYDANIIMGIGEDESLGEAISLTVVATGFAPDQQNNITNTETKKIVHTLEDEQKATYNFSEQTVTKTPTIDEPLKEEKPEKIVHVLEDEVEEPTPCLGLVKTTAEIANIDVLFEEVNPSVEEVSAEDFVFNDITPKVEESIINEEEEVQQDLLFDLPLNKATENRSEEKTIQHSLEDNIQAGYNIEVEEEEIGVENNEVPIEKRYTLSDFDVQPTIGKSSTIVNEQEVEEEEIQFTVKQTVPKEEINDINIISEEISPLDLTLAQVQERAAHRRSKFMKMNHKFTDAINKNIDEIEKQPAYKRQGLELGTNSSISKAKTALKKDGDDLGLSSNNSFLHDNVD